LNESIEASDLVTRAIHLVERARSNDIVLRIMGASAVMVHVGIEHPSLEAFKSNRVLTDIDFVTYRKHWPQIESFLQFEGYAPHVRFNAIHGDKQLQFANRNGTRVDVFCDRLSMSHVIDFKGRLEQDYPTIPLAELLLEKMQIVRINEKDIKDTALLLKTHNIGDTDNDMVNARHIAELLRDDWGFYYTVTTNLDKVKKRKDEYDWLSDSDRQEIDRKIDGLCAALQAEPKSTRWKLRAKVGTRKKWYTDVDEQYG
jgi:hypothetical protein